MCKDVESTSVPLLILPADRVHLALYMHTAMNHAHLAGSCVKEVMHYKIPMNEVIPVSLLPVQLHVAK